MVEFRPGEENGWDLGKNEELIMGVELKIGGNKIKIHY